MIRSCTVVQPSRFAEESEESAQEGSGSDGDGDCAREAKKPRRCSKEPAKVGNVAVVLLVECQLTVWYGI